MNKPWTARHSPSDIEVMIWYYARCEPHPRDDAPAVRDALARFVTQGLLRKSTFEDISLSFGGRDSGYRATEKGKAWVEMLCSTPYPKQVWIDPRTDKNDN